MAAILPTQQQIVQRVVEPDRGTSTRHTVARLAELHAEAEETAQLANLLGRSIHVAIALPVLAAAALVAGRIGVAQSAAWIGFVLCASFAIAHAYRRTIGRPFERAALKSFSQDLGAILVFAGFAWGAGAFLALPADAGIVPAVLLTAGAGAVVTVLLRDRMSAFQFLAPVAALASFACVLRPLADGPLGAAFVLIACGAVAAGAVFAGPKPAQAEGVAEFLSA